jgi:hypothetical protein
MKENMTHDLDDLIPDISACVWTASAVGLHQNQNQN